MALCRCEASESSGKLSNICQVLFTSFYFCFLALCASLPNGRVTLGTKASTIASVRHLPTITNSGDAQAPLSASATQTCLFSPFPDHSWPLYDTGRNRQNMQNRKNRPASARAAGPPLSSSVLLDFLVCRATILATSSLRALPSDL